MRQYVHVVDREFARRRAASADRYSIAYRWDTTDHRVRGKGDQVHSNHPGLPINGHQLVLEFCGLRLRPPDTSGR